MNKTKLFILSIVLLKEIQAASQVANFPLITDMKSGEHKLLLRTAVGPSSATLIQQYRSSTFSVVFSAIPQVAIGLLVYEAKPTNDTVNFFVQAIEIKTNQFTSKITIPAGTTINQLRYMYFAIPRDSSYGNIYYISDYQNLTDFTGTINNSIQKIHNFNDNYNLSHENIFLTFLVSFGIQQSNKQFSVKVESFQNSQTDFKTLVSSNSTLMHVNFYVIHVDRTLLTQTVLYFIDQGFNYGQNNKLTESFFSAPISSFNYYNYIQGMNWISLATQQILSLNFNGNPDPLSSLGTYKYARSNMLHWRRRNCTSYTYYLDAQSKCYDSCPSRYVNNDLYKYCLPCPYSCLNCLSDGLTCSQCSPTSANDNAVDVFRQLNNGSCLCIDGYYDSGIEACQSCHYTCLTCQSNSTFCLSCDSTRQLKNNSCSCLLRKYDTNNNDSVCQSCDYTCQICEGSSTHCTKCLSNSNRQLTADNKCLCSSGFSANVNQEICKANPALVCVASCKTCQNSSSTCTSCVLNVNRIFNSSKNTCNCITGYQSLNGEVQCIQICGDGKVYKDQCDDGNTNDGDGCSSVCKFQADYKCNNKTQPTRCIYQLGYKINISSIVKDKNANRMFFKFTVIPAPPANTVPAIELVNSTVAASKTNSTKLQAHLNLVTVSYQFNGVNLSMTLEYTESIPEFTYARLSLGSQVGTSQNFQVVDDNGLALNYYSEQTYNLYYIQIVLIWVLIGLTWFGVIVFTVIDKSSILKNTELLISIGFAWIGSMGLYRYLIYYDPLINLKYIFGYNQVISGEDGLLAFVNYGLILNIFPAFLFLVLVLVAKFKGISLTQYTKKFVLVQLSFSWLCFNSLIVIFGLFTEAYTQTYSTPLSIASLFMGILYFLILVGSSIYFCKIQQSFVYFKSQMKVEQRRGPIFFITILAAKLIFSLIFLQVGYYNLNARKYMYLFLTGLACISIALVFVIKPYTSNFRILINQFFLMLIFLCYFMIQEIQGADWGGFAILIILYCQVFLNFLMMGLSAKQKLSKLQQNDPEGQIQVYDPDDLKNDSGIYQGSQREGEVGYFGYIDPRVQRYNTELKKYQQASQMRQYVDKEYTLRKNFQIQRFERE